MSDTPVLPWDTYYYPLWTGSNGLKNKNEMILGHPVQHIKSFTILSLSASNLNFPQNLSSLVSRKLVDLTYLLSSASSIWSRLRPPCSSRISLYSATH